ncbi:MAG: DUF3887 domain-containing protein [Roseburia sp.]|nr:DUF3887 domain-containing protein [Lachnospiraceae bacterium]MDY4839439.1 DUF3887 domain-containing protein [Lachnospiraceae bacterium]
MTAEQYVNRIGKKIKCSGKKKKEIKRQILSDVLVAMENGETVDDIMKHMGSIDEVAFEFNQNLSEEEQKTYARARKRNRILTILGIVIVLFGLIYWMLPKTAEIESSGVFAKDALENQTKWVIEKLDNNDFEALETESIGEMKKALNPEVIEDARRQVGSDWGEIQSFGDFYMSEIRQRGQRYAVVQVAVMYENVEVTYTITFDENMKLAGLYMK